VHPLTPLAVRVGRSSWLPRFLPQIEALDRALQRASRGRLGLLDLAGLPWLSLTVVGRRTGQLRTTPLLCVPHEGAYLVAGSYWGNPRRPVWALNLLANPDATVATRGRSQAVRARLAEGAERDRLWQVMLRTWPNYAEYARRTDRDIPVFVLEPTNGSWVRR
jgi:deazaflavin-dependent oxidoreductase (nitroreductase family)